MEVSERRGRPKTRWKVSVMRDMRRIGVGQEEAMNRECMTYDAPPATESGALLL